MRHCLEIQCPLEPRVPIPTLNLERNPAIKLVLQSEHREALDAHFTPVSHSSPASPQPSGDDKLSSSSHWHETSVPSPEQLADLTLPTDAFRPNLMQPVAVGFSSRCETGWYESVAQQAQFAWSEQWTRAAADDRGEVTGCDLRSRLPESKGFQRVKGSLELRVGGLERVSHDVILLSVKYNFKFFQ